MKKITLIMIILLIIVLLFPACSEKESEGASATIQPGKSSSPQANSSDSKQASSDAGSEGLMIKPEQLLSKEEAAALIGESLKTGISEEYPLLGLNTCFYAPDKPDSKCYLQICLIQQNALKQKEGGGDGGESSAKPSESGQSNSEQSGESGGGSGGSSGGEISPKTLYEGFKKLFSDPNTAMTGRIGDDIFISAQGISVLSGEYCIVILIGASDPSQAQTALKQASELAVKNLKRIKGE